VPDVRGFSLRSLGRPQDRFAALILPPLLLVFAALVGLLIAFDTAAVVGESMLPNLEPEDRLFVSRSYDEPIRGDVVLIDHPEVPGARAVKRVLAVGGDEVAFRGDVIWVDGEIADGFPVIQGEDVISSGSLVVPDDSVFLAGDNRPTSLDSRSYGPIPLSYIKGRVVAVYSPVTRIGLVDGGASAD
jgi:signal peptidase I